MTNPFTNIYLTYLRLKNNLDYPLRQRFPFRTAPVTGSHPISREILSSYPETDRNKVQLTISRLNSRYQFQNFADTHAVDEIRENYYYLSMLDEAFQKSGVILPDAIKAADIGPSSWFYVHALAAALHWYGSPVRRNIHLAGFELDAHRVYSDFHTRKDHALGNMQGLQDVEFLDRGFERQHDDAYNVITMFFPFVFEKDHLEWGLPDRLFNPTDLLNAAWKSLRPGGLLMIVNQGLDEHKAQMSFFKELNIPVAAAFNVEPLLYTYPLDRYIITAIHEH